MIQRLRKSFLFTNQDQNNINKIVDRYLYYRQSRCLKNIVDCVLILGQISYYLPACMD